VSGTSDTPFGGDIELREERTDIFSAEVAEAMGGWQAPRPSIRKPSAKGQFETAPRHSGRRSSLRPPIRPKDRPARKRSFITLAIKLLPVPDRDRYLEEWRGTLHFAPTRTLRAWFTISLLVRVLAIRKAIIESGTLDQQEERGT
jgi:hypothetical protein